MIRSLWTAASGMIAQQMNIDVTSNNLANVNTTGFKKSRAEFEDLMYQTHRVAGAENVSGIRLPTGLQIGLGSRTVEYLETHCRMPANLTLSAWRALYWYRVIQAAT